MNLFEYYKNNPTLFMWTIIIFIVCAVIGIVSICIRKWIRNKKMENPLVLKASDFNYQPSDNETDGEEPADAIEIYDDEDNKA